jgi:hypothetical protein
LHETDLTLIHPRRGVHGHRDAGAFEGH